MPQDMPPTGGYEAIQYKRNLPARGFRPAYYLLAMGVICTYGFYKVGKGIREHKYGPIPFRIAFLLPGRQNGISAATYMSSPPPSSRHPLLMENALARRRIFIADIIGDNSELAREKMWSRIYLIPLLQAEEDRDLVRKHLADQAREKALLGTQTSPYNSDRFVRPHYAVTPTKVMK
ncbi:hypothetical protein MMC09_003818 [Bachmanniomyces sp. S44760]|nr:hypothetical protein [Bachmanniomyces sp. S44760]